MNYMIPNAPETTGKYLVLFDKAADLETAIQLLGDLAGIHSVAKASDFKGGALNLEQLREEEAAIFDDLKVAVCSFDPSQLESMSAASSEEGGAVLTVEPEQVMYAFASMDYLKGYRDGIEDLSKRLLAGEVEEAGKGFPSGQEAEAQAGATWGLQATRVLNSRFSGRGIRVAVLDTGMDLQHPDFVGRPIVGKSFISGEAVQDGNGHGTHCIGTSCGPLNASPRYGIAYNAEIYAGKVLSNQGSGADGGILAGIQWAITNRCRVVSMSLGARVRPGESFSQIYENVAQRALSSGTLIIVAAGNDSARPGQIKPVSRSANCPSMMAVAALDSALRIAFFSNGGLNPRGGQVDIAGPGVAVHSSWPMPTRYNTISGTSMATPHVAGIAALFAEANPGAGAQTLWNLLIRNARRLILPSRDVGSGLVQAP
jgi:subtilisin family serine protease